MQTSASKFMKITMLSQSLSPPPLLVLFFQCLPFTRVSLPALSFSILLLVIPLHVQPKSRQVLDCGCVDNYVAIARASSVGTLQVPLDTDPLMWWKQHVQDFPRLVHSHSPRHGVTHRVTQCHTPRNCESLAQYRTAPSHPSSWQ